MLRALGAEASTGARRRTGSLFKSVAWLIRPEPLAALFALRLVLAVSAALYLSMWLELERPYWSGLEVALMIQLLPGNTVTRAAARVIGTLVAGAAALVILGLFQQTPELMIVALACWVSACAFGLQLFRGDVSQGFGVVGFITGVIVMFTVSASSGSTPFEVAQARVAECCVAAVMVAVVNVLFSTGITARRYDNQRRSVLAALGAELQAVIDTARRGYDTASGQAGDPHPRLAALAKQILALEQMRPYVKFEQPGFAVFDRLAQRMDQDLLALTSVLSSLHIFLVRRSAGRDEAALECLRPVADALVESPAEPVRLKTEIDQARRALDRRQTASARQNAPGPLAERIVLGRTLEIADRLGAVLTRHRILVAEDRHATAGRRPVSSGYSWPVNWPRVIRNSLASFTAIMLGGLVWLNFHNQMATIITVALGGAIATLFSAAPSPVSAAANFAKGTVAATMASFVIAFFWFPMANGFATYVVLTAPVLFVAGLAMTQPSIALPGRITVVVFELTLHTQNALRIDFFTFAQFALGIYGAVAVAMLAFNLLLERSPERHLRYQIRDIFDEPARGLHGPRARFEARIYDRLDRLALLDDQGRHPYGVNQAVLAAIGLVLEARRLKIYTERLARGGALRAEAADVVARLEHGLQSQGKTADFRALGGLLDRLADDLESARARTDTAATRRLVDRAEIAARLMTSALADYEQAMQDDRRSLSSLAHAG